MSVRLVRAVQTSLACPSQWDAWDAEGNYFYLRFRHGHGSVVSYRSAGWETAEPFEKGRCVASFDHGDQLDGLMGLAEFAERAGLVLAAGMVETPFWDHIRDELVLRGVIGPELLEGDQGGDEAGD